MIVIMTNSSVTLRPVGWSRDWGGGGGGGGNNEGGTN